MISKVLHDLHFSLNQSLISANDWYVESKIKCTLVQTLRLCTGYGPWGE